MEYFCEQEGNLSVILNIYLVSWLVLPERVVPDEGVIFGVVASEIHAVLAYVAEGISLPRFKHENQPRIQLFRPQLLHNVYPPLIKFFGYLERHSHDVTCVSPDRQLRIPVGRIKGKVSHDILFQTLLN